MMHVFVLIALSAKLAQGVRNVKKQEEEIPIAPHLGACAFDKVQTSLKNAAVGSKGIASMAQIGTTAHMKAIWAVRIKGEDYNRAPGKTLLFTFNLENAGSLADAGVYAVEEMIRMTREFPAWLGNTRVVIVPVANPDGFAVAQNHGQNSWRKNAPGGLDYCLAVNLNRNFRKGWTPTSEGKCSSSYPGPSPLSEPESRALAKKIRANTSVLINVEGSGALDITVGYSCSGCGRPTNLNQLFALAGAVTRDMTAVHDRRHQTILARGGASSGTITDYSLNQGVLAANMRTGSKEESLAGLLAAIAFAKGI